jgi:hypothetical protein
MFLGHYGLGFAAKKAAPGTSLGALFTAAQFADLLWPTLLLAGVEHVDVQPGATRVTPLAFVSYPYSHSLLALAGWGVLLAVGYTAATRSRIAPGITLALLVLSHWFLDVLMHRPDLPLTLTGTARFGFGLWNSVPATLFIELATFLTGVALYARATTARDRVGSAGLWSLALFLVTVYFASIFGPPPPSAGIVAWSAESLWLIVVWAYWVDRHRSVGRQK